MNIQRGVLEGSKTPVARLGTNTGWSWADLLADARVSAAQSGREEPSPGRRSRVPDEDIVLIGRTRPSETPAQSPQSKNAGARLGVRSTILLGLAAYYMALGLYQGVSTYKPRGISVEPSLNSRTVVT